MALKNNNPSVIQEEFCKEYAERNKWTRAWVEEHICDMIRFAATLSPRNPQKTELVKSIPAKCSVKYDWLESVIADADAKFPAQLHIPTNCYDKLYDFITDWLDSVDNTLDRRLIIMHSCWCRFKQSARGLAYRTSAEAVATRRQ